MRSEKQKRPAVALLCSGLGHVLRGNETWALTVAEAMSAAGFPVQLFTGGSLPNKTLAALKVLNLRRDTALLRLFCSWHYRYLIEQYTFAWSMRRWLASKQFAIVHTAEPALALLLHKWRLKYGYEVIYKDGLSLGAHWCSHFSFVQVLAPFYLEQAQSQGFNTNGWQIIPHMVRPEFLQRPAKICSGLEKLFETKTPKFVILSIGDFSEQSKKRLGWILEECASLQDPEIWFVAAGQATHSQWEDFQRLAGSKMDGRAVILRNVPPEEIPMLMGSASVFAHGALQEPFGIVFLEAMVTSLPVLAHRYPVTKWIIGNGGLTLDMTKKGELASQIRHLKTNPALRRELGASARQRVLQEFSTQTVVPQYLSFYEAILNSKKR